VLSGILALLAEEFLLTFDDDGEIAGLIAKSAEDFAQARLMVQAGRTKMIIIYQPNSLAARR
jgi:hypothetical protein